MFLFVFTFIGQGQTAEQEVLAHNFLYSGGNLQSNCLSLIVARDSPA
jgi:hypothetical protein